MSQEFSIKQYSGTWAENVPFVRFILPVSMVCSVVQMVFLLTNFYKFAILSANLSRS